MRSAFSTIVSELSPQYAGSSCVRNCSMSGKKQPMLPSASAARNSACPASEENAVAGGEGSGRRWKLAISRLLAE